MPELNEVFDNAKTMPFEAFKENVFDLATPDQEYFGLNAPQSLLLIERYPFLLPKNRFTKKPLFDIESARETLFKIPLATLVLDSQLQDIAYSALFEASPAFWQNAEEALKDSAGGSVFSELIALDSGWLKRFGLELVEDVNDLLVASSNPDPYKDYAIDQIKEKFGTLRYYDSGIPSDIYDEMSALIQLYEFVSGYTCISCGEIEGVRFYGGWISPYCAACAGKDNRHMIDESEGKDITKTLSDIVLSYSYEKDPETEKSVQVAHTAAEEIANIAEKLGYEPRVAKLVEETVAIANAEHNWTS